MFESNPLIGEDCEQPREPAHRKSPKEQTRAVKAQMRKLRKTLAVNRKLLQAHQTRERLEREIRETFERLSQYQ